MVLMVLELILVVLGVVLVVLRVVLVVLGGSRLSFLIKRFLIKGQGVYLRCLRFSFARITSRILRATPCSDANRLSGAPKGPPRRATAS